MIGTTVSVVSLSGGCKTDHRRIQVRALDRLLLAGGTPAVYSYLFAHPPAEGNLPGSFCRAICALPQSPAAHGLRACSHPATIYNPTPTFLAITNAGEHGIFAPHASEIAFVYGDTLSPPFIDFHRSFTAFHTSFLLRYPLAV